MRIHRLLVNFGRHKSELFFFKNVPESFFLKNPGNPKKLMFSPGKLKKSQCYTLRFSENVLPHGAVGGDGLIS